MTIEWRLEKRKVSQLQEYEKNPRYITKEDLKQLKTSIDKFGLIDKPIINVDNTIIGGHQRINALKALGIKSIECWVPNRELDHKEIEECNIRLNKNTGSWNFEVLANEWNLDDLLEWGFTAKELEIDAIGEMDKAIEDEVEKIEKEQEMISCPKCGHDFERE